MTLSDCANGAAGLGIELFGRRPPNAESAKRMRKAAAAVMSIIHIVYDPARLPANGVLIRIVIS
jgi:hypothetical protein